MINNSKTIFNLDSLKIYAICFYITLNFIDRSISNIFLLLALILTLIDYKKVYESIIIYKFIYISVILFTLWIIIVGNLHHAPAHELDNYLRLIFLLPLLSVKFDEEILKKILIFSVFFATIHFIHSSVNGLEERYIGTASNQITYANMLVTFLILLIFFIIRNHDKKKFIYLICFFLLTYFWILTGTRGPLISLIVASLFIVFWSKNIQVVFMSVLIGLFIIFIPNPLSDRLSNLYTLDTLNPEKITHQSLQERISYIKYGIKVIKGSPIYGLGPHNIEPNMELYLAKKNINVPSRDHLHNEFIDISAKFGVFSAILLILCYISFYLSSHQLNKKIVALLLVSLIISQLTQSHFAHHQAITFFISLIYLMITKKDTIKI